ncbi:hypothetical protein [Zhihengliuella halotolerans]|uniref:hypothetical protein n=1 Tax=Zhihengliuella halotolerans TaxID=370736 RepID=UPI000C7FFFDC|nr:hypothetical protein [Zhihengliuella halotolerans]
MKQHLDALRLLRTKYQEEFRKIQSYTDPHLSNEGILAERKKRTDALRAEAKQALDTVRARAADDRDALTRRMEKAMPKPEGSTADAWARVRMLLDAGRDLNKVIKTADVPTLQAIREWAPTWLETQRSAETLHDALGGGRQPIDTTGLDNTIAIRWAELSGNDTAIREHLESRGDAAKFDYLAEASDQTFTTGHHGSELDVVMGAEMAAAGAKVTLDSGTPTEAA